ncbi:lectin subunit alpha-like [Haematobia irritans]|uniref:lectin subunit alpha-like n=1 Tax=Haematobia irritans TaxID=7368 RepID=UPI003F500708
MKKEDYFAILQTHLPEFVGKSAYPEDEVYDAEAAARECTRRGLQLVEIKSQEKNAAFDALLRSLFKKSPDLWIGGRDNGSSDKQRPFHWIMSEKPFAFTSWGPGQPDNYRNVEHCVHIYSATDFLWNDANCSSKLGYICEGRFFD